MIRPPAHMTATRISRPLRTRAEVEGRLGYPAQPLITPPPMRSTCRHLAKPGLAGFPRNTREPAYGSNHPLRQLPADHGEDCWLRVDRLSEHASNDAAEPPNTALQGVST